MCSHFHIGTLAEGFAMSFHLISSMVMHCCLISFLPCSLLLPARLYLPPLPSQNTIANLETFTDMQSWYKIWPLNGSNLIRTKTKLHNKSREICKNSWSQIGILKSITLTIPWNSEKLVKIFHGIIARLHHTDQKQMVLPKELCAE